MGVGTVRWVGREAGREGRSVGTNVPGVPGNDGRLAADAQVGLRCEISRDATRSDARRGRPTRAPTYLRGGRFASSVSVRRRRRDRCFGGGHRVPSLASSRDVRSAASDARSVPTRRARDCAKNAPERRVTASEPVPRLVPWSDGAGCFCSERRFESRVANASVSVARRDERVVGVGNASSAKTSPGTSERCRRAIARVVRGGERFRFRRRRFDRESAASNRSRRASIGHLLSNDAINRAHARGRQEIVRSTRWCSPRPGIANRSSWLARRASRTSSRARRTPAARTVAHRPTVVDLLDAPPAMAPPGEKHVTFSEPTKGGRGGLRRVPTGGKGTLTAAAKVAAEAGTSSADTLEVRTSVLSASLHRSRRSTERRCDGRGANPRGRPGDRGPPSV